MTQLAVTVGALSMVAVAAAILERQRWTARMFGHNTIGAALFLAHTQDRRWISALELAEMAEVSEDTARRQLSKLVSLGRVETRVFQKRIRKYRLVTKIGQRAEQMALLGIVP